MVTRQVHNPPTIDALQQQVVELSEKLQRAEKSCQQKQREQAQLMAKLQEASRAKVAFFSNMSHEIRTPMNAITGFSQLMMATDLTEKQRYYLQQVTHGGDVLLRLINALFDLSKLESGTFRLDQGAFVLDELVKRLDRSLLPNAEQKGLSFDVRVDNDIPDELTGDGGRIYQVLFNLVENAIKFTEKGTVSLHIGFTPLDHSTDQDQGVSGVQGHLKIVVKDSGIGMDKALRMRLFRPFTLGDDSLTRQQGGSGLGLAICHHLLALMGGKVTVTSTLGEGSEFHITIPLGFTDRETGYGHASSYGSLAGRRVLLVDDRVINRQIANEILSDWGMVVIEAEDGVQAIQLLEQEPCDLVLMDLLMPVMGGVEATRRIRAQPEFASLPIVAMTGNSSEKDRAECIAAGMNDVLVKPIDFDALPAQLLCWLKERDVSISQPCKDVVSDQATDMAAHHLPSLSPEIEDADRNQALQALGGNETLYCQLLDHFPTEHTQTPSHIRQALLLYDLPTAERLVHTLKSSAASLGARSLAGIAAEIEQGLRVGELPSPVMLQDVEKGCDQLVRVLLDQGFSNDDVAIIGNNPVSELHLPDGEFARQIGQLRDALGRGEERSIAMLEEMLPYLRVIDAAGAERIRQLVDGFDFVAAAELLKQVSNITMPEEE